MMAVQHHVSPLRGQAQAKHRAVFFPFFLSSLTEVGPF